MTRHARIQIERLSTRSGGPERRAVAEQKERAEAVLRSLLEAKASCEEEGSRLNRSDLYKTVTGRSAWDASIAATQRMIESLDRALAAAGVEVEIRAAGLLGRDRLSAR
jgi:hypothetical protein